MFEKKNPPYNLFSSRCNLCLWEKYFIVSRPKLVTLNKRNELVTSCRETKKILPKKLDAYRVVATAEIQTPRAKNW